MLRNKAALYASRSLLGQHDLGTGGGLLEEALEHRGGVEFLEPLLAFHQVLADAVGEPVVLDVVDGRELLVVPDHDDALAGEYGT